MKSVLLFLIIILLTSSLALSQNTGDREENRQEIEILQEITRIVTGLRFLEENRDLSLHQEQVKEILSLLASLVDEGLIYRARSLRIEVLEVLSLYVIEGGAGYITQELGRRGMEDHREGVVAFREGNGEQGGRQDDREDISSSGSTKREDQIHLGMTIIEDLEQILSKDQLRFIENLPLSSLIGSQVSRGRGQMQDNQESGEFLLLFEELVEWFLWEKVSF